MLKTNLRKIYKEKRLSISTKEKLRLDDLLLLQFQQFNFSKLQILLTYWPMAKANEPNTQLFTAYLRHTIPNLQIAYPVIDVATKTMQAILINEHTIYEANTYGIYEPKQGDVVNITDIDLVFAPLLICDKFGYRVGFGKGYYDKFLADCREDAIIIGFNYFDPIDKIEDTNQFDVPLNYCITSQKIYEF